MKPTLPFGSTAAGSTGSSSALSKSTPVNEASASSPVVERPSDARPARDEFEQLRITLARAIHQRTSGGVRQLRVEVDRRSVRLFGHCHTFYCKQLAQQTVMALAADAVLTNDIEVD